MGSYRSSRLSLPILGEIADDYQGKVKVVTVDIDDCDQLTRKYGIKTVPTLLVFNVGAWGAVGKAAYTSSARTRARRNAPARSKVQSAHEASVSFLAVVGRREVERETMTLRGRGGQRELGLEEAVVEIQRECHPPI